MITDEITYTPGRLAKKLGISKSKLMRHLRDTGLIEQCRLTQSGHWQIPYSVAARISSVEALSAPSPTPISRQTRARNNRGNEPKEPKSFFNSQTKPISEFTNARSGLMVSIPNYAQIGKTLRQAGVTMVDLIKYFEQQMGVTHEQTPNNSGKREENQANESKTTSVGASSDISNSSEK